MKQRQQYDVLLNIMDQTRSKCMSAHQQINDVKRYLAYCEENPFTKFMPRSLKFNGKSYQDYEREFLNYYNMAQSARGAWQC